MYRYRKMDGRSITVLPRFDRHSSKLGTPIRVEGVRYFGKYTDFEVVYIKGTHGTMRLDGISWGYGGEGPRTLCNLLKEIGIDGEKAKSIAFNQKRSSDPLCDNHIPINQLVKQPHSRLVEWSVTLPNETSDEDNWRKLVKSSEIKKSLQVTDTTN